MFVVYSLEPVPMNSG